MVNLWLIYGFYNGYPLVNKNRPRKSTIFNGFTSLPSPTTARVELLIYQRVMYYTHVQSFPNSTSHLEIYPLVICYIANWKDPPCLKGELPISMGHFPWPC